VRRFAVKHLRSGKSAFPLFSLAAFLAYNYLDIKQIFMERNKMKKLLHIIAAPRGEDSRTLQVSEVFLHVFRQEHSDWVVEELDITKEKLPSLTMKRIDGKYVLLSGRELTGDLKRAWQEIIAHIDRFLSADAYLLSTPMWNFNIPYLLKQYIDIIIQPKYLFRYTDTGGIEGLVKGKKMTVVTSRGGDYSPRSPSRDFDHQEPYLRTIFGFVGITDINFIIAQPMDMDTDKQKAALQRAKEEAAWAAKNFVPSEQTYAAGLTGR
jgi:FMN-dependent NADH-azoreductase